MLDDDNMTQMNTVNFKTKYSNKNERRYCWLMNTVPL